MGEFKSGLVHRTSQYFNKPEFSDVEFLILEENKTTVIHAHRQILSMASAEFAMFFKEYPQKPIVQIKISADEFSPRIVNLVLLYLYSDELFIKNLEEAADVYKLADKFGVTELKHKCRKYLSDPSIDNVLTVYEIALRENVVTPLKKCRELVSQNTAEVLASPRFLDASVIVLKDIFNLNSLSVKESEILSAVMKWARRDCKKKRRPTENICLRESISPLLPYIRILTLSINEFCEFTDEFDIFTSSESTNITRLILEPNPKCSIPEGFCPIKVPRSTSVQRLQNGLKNPSTFKVPESVPKNNVENHTRPAYKIPVLSTKNRLSPPSVVSQNKRTPPSLRTPPPVPFTPHQNGVWDDNLDTPEMPLFQFAASTPTIPPPAKRQPMLKVVNNQMTSSKKIYDFPLQEMKLGLNAVSESDLICSAEIVVLRGFIVIYGVELKVMNSSPCSKEDIKVFTQISGGLFPEKVIDKHYPLVNNMIQVDFPEPLKLNENGQTPAKIEMTIEDLKLSRCNVCRVSTCEINSGLNLSTTIKLKSNQPNQGDGCFYFISRLIYS